MADFLIGSVVGIFFVGCVAAPFLAPWRVRVRYLVNAQVGDPVLGLAAMPSVVLREVTVVSVESGQGHVEIVVDESGGSDRFRRRRLMRSAAPPAVVAKLDGWSATHTPLLLVVDEARCTHLYGPDGVVTDLDRVEETIT
ncbi:MAG: hypothetical protein QOI08_1966 [Actinomycetota bacterium]|jgi:hypothetical protein|nr:hypothetical protein [Actinomycetota bacterium]